MTRTQKHALITGFISLTMLFMTFAQAAMVSTTETLNESDRAALHNTLERKNVQQQLVQMGVDPVKAIKRIDSMTNEEIANINGQIEALPAGAGVSTVELLLIIIIILLLV